MLLSHTIDIKNRTSPTHLSIEVTPLENDGLAWKLDLNPEGDHRTVQTLRRILRDLSDDIEGKPGNKIRYEANSEMAWGGDGRKTAEFHAVYSGSAGVNYKDIIALVLERMDKMQLISLDDEQEYLTKMGIPVSNELRRDLNLRALRNGTPQEHGR